MTWSERFLKRGSALCIGLDPVLGRIPPGCSVTDFCLEVVDATADHAACFKPNIAFFERLGRVALEGLVTVVAAIRERGLPVIMDAKRGDVPGTAKVYAETYFGGPFDCDALTVNASVGLDALAPFVDRARDLDRGVFVLLRTSNPGAAVFQEAMEPILVDAIRREPVLGAVVGATADPSVGARLRVALPDTLFLVPGFGAQGGDDLGPFFVGGGPAVVNSSRAICYAGEGQAWPERKEAIRDAARAAHETIERVRKG